MHKGRDPIDENEPCVIVLGPSWDRTTGLLPRMTTVGQTRDTWASADFYGKWLLAAAKADAVWQRVKAEPRYEKQLEHVPKDYLPTFGPTALWLVSQLAKNAFTAIVSMNGREEELRGWFLTMRHIGFFAFPTKYYEMRVPHQLSMPSVKNAVLAGTVRLNDWKLCLRPEYSSPTMSFAAATALQIQLIQKRAGQGRPEYPAPTAMRLH
jgi:hypothetical protein